MARKLIYPEHLQVRLPPGWMAALDGAAKAAKLSRQELLRRVIAAFLAEKGGKVAG